MTSLSSGFVGPLLDFSPEGLGSSFSFAGEMGMVSRGTCELGSRKVGGVSTAAIVGEGQVRVLQSAIAARDAECQVNR